jgi:hypothetical protein
MATPKPIKFFYRALFKPDSLDVFEGFDRDFDWKGKALGYTQAWHRRSWAESPYAVYNEFICAELGRAIRLPVPPFAITYSQEVGKRKIPLFSSLDFNFQRSKLPPVIPDICVAHLPQLCAGVLAFDIFVANQDRHDENLLVDRGSKPREMHVYDHDQALLGGHSHAQRGSERLSLLRDRLGITGGPVTGGNKHVFLPHIKTCEYLYAWAEQIREIPTWFIKSVCLEAKRHGLDNKLANETNDFLQHRRDKIVGIIDANRGSFSIDDWPAQKGFL